MENPHKKLTFVYNNTKRQSTNYSPYFLLFGRNRRLPVDLMFDVNTNNDINKSHSNYIQNWQNNKILQRNSKSNYDKKNSRFHVNTWRESFTEKFVGKRRDRET